MVHAFLLVVYPIISGDLNLSRALGDHRYKENKDIPPECQMISAMPDLRYDYNYLLLVLL